MLPPTVLDCVLPGAGLVLRGRLAWGVPCLVLSVLCLSSAILAQLVVIRPLATWVTLGCLGVYVVVALCAVAVQRLSQRVRTLAGEDLRRRHRAIATAWLSGDNATAVSGARTLVQDAASEPGAWRLLELIAGRGGHPQEAARAGRRARRLELLRDEAA